jgi:hypothetical protein
VALEELVRLLLAAGHLERLGELLLLGGVAARKQLLGRDAPARADDERPPDADARDREEQDRRDRDGLAAPERAAAARVDDRLHASVRRAEAVHDRLAAQRRRGVAPAPAATGDEVDRLLRLLLPARGDLRGLRDGVGEVAVAGRLGLDGALGGGDVGAARTVRIEEAAVGGQDVAAQAGLLVEHRREHLLRAAVELVVALVAGALVGRGRPDRDRREEGPRENQGDGQANAGTGRPAGARVDAKTGAVGIGTPRSSALTTRD